MRAEKPMSSRPGPEIFDDTRKAFLHLSNGDIRRAFLVFSVVNHPWISAVATGLLKIAMVLHLPVMWLVKTTIFRQFCGGETAPESEQTISRIGKFGVKTILDYSVEGEKTEAGFDQTCNEVLATFTTAEKNSNVPLCVFKVTGLADSGLLEKLAAGAILNSEEVSAAERIRQRVERICKRAFESGVPVLMDAEESWIQQPIDQLSLDMMRKYNIQRPIVYNTFQLYRKGMLDSLKNFSELATKEGFKLGVKLVRGAYMEKERKRASEFGYPDPIQPDKDSTDKQFNEAITYCLDQPHMSLVCGSHNEDSTLLLMQGMESRGIAANDTRIWFSQLLGMSDNISFNLAQLGYNVVKYVPFGPVRSVIPYLIRRAEENTSVAGQSSRELLLIRQERTRRKAG